jgi:protein tyrosine/serine phosphatase
MSLGRWVLALAVLAVWSAEGFCETARDAQDELPRFREVAPGIFRGGQPQRGGFELLKQRGVKTIINLRDEHDERKQVEALGFRYVYLPMDARDEVSASSIQMFLDTVSDPAQQPVFIHCRLGIDRTGFMVGLYRIAKQGWSSEKAYDEARDIGMRWWYRGLKRQLFEFAERVRADGSGAAGK